MGQDSGAGDPQLQAIQRQISDLLVAGQTAAGEAMAVEALARWPEHPALLRMLGSARVKAGRWAEAESFYRRSLAREGAQPLVILKLAHVLSFQGRGDEARNAFGDAKAAFITAIAREPHKADLQYGLAATLQVLRDYSGAEQAFRETLRLDPARLPAKIGLAESLNAQQRPDEAVAALTAIAAGDAATKGIIEYHLGVARLLKNQHQPALAHFDRALTLAPERPGIQHMRATALQHLSREEEALEALRRAVAENPSDLAAHRDLNNLLFRLNREEEFLSSYDRATAAMPGMADFAIAKASFLLQREKEGEALALYDHALRKAPGNLDAMRGRAFALLRMNEANAAIAGYLECLKRAPEDGPGQVELLTSLGMAYLSGRDPAKAEAALRQALTLDAHDQTGLALLGTAWRLQNDAREEDLNGYESLIQIIDLEPPEGYADIESFNRDLALYLQSLHRDAREHIDQSASGGTQTLGNIFGAGHKIVEPLRERIEEALRRYIAALPENPDHPFLGRRGRDVRFRGAWSTRLVDCGYHRNHIHPDGWISSAYYIELPGTVTDTQKKEGWIKFGEPAFDVGLADPVRRAVQPKSGRLVLFPSYLWHGTVPFRSPQSRTTIAFDAVPV